MNFKRNFYKIARFVNRNLPTIFSYGAIVGLGLSTYFTAKTAPEISSIISQIDLDNPNKKEENKLLIKEAMIVSIPVDMCVFTTGALIFSSNLISRKRIRAIGTAYNNLSRSFNEYKLAALSGLGVDGYNKIQTKYAEEYLENNENVIEDGKCIFFEEYSKQTFSSTLEDVIAAEYHLNRNFILRGYATLNEFYEFLGIEPIEGGELLCWSIDAGCEYYGYQWVDFVNREHEDKDGGKWYSIEIVFLPTLDDYMHYLDYGTSMITDSNGEIIDSQKLHAIE